MHVPSQSDFHEGSTISLLLTQGCVGEHVNIHANAFPEPLVSKNENVY